MKVPAFLFLILYINYASAKVRETRGFPDTRARSHGAYSSDTCKHVRPSMYHVHFCLRAHYIMNFVHDACG